MVRILRLQISINHAPQHLHYSYHQHSDVIQFFLIVVNIVSDLMRPELCCYKYIFPAASPQHHSTAVVNITVVEVEEPACLSWTVMSRLQHQSNIIIQQWKVDTTQGRAERPLTRATYWQVSCTRTSQCCGDISEQCEEYLKYLKY